MLKSTRDHPVWENSGAAESLIRPTMCLSHGPLLVQRSDLDSNFFSKFQKCTSDKKMRGGGVKMGWGENGRAAVINPNFMEILDQREILLSVIDRFNI